MTFYPAKSNSNYEPNRVVAAPQLTDEEFKAAQQAYQTERSLHADLRRQLKEEIGDDETLVRPVGRFQDLTKSERTQLAKYTILQHKFGLSRSPIAFTPTEKFWIRREGTA